MNKDGILYAAFHETHKALDYRQFPTAESLERFLLGKARDIQNEALQAQAVEVGPRVQAARILLAAYELSRASFADAAEQYWRERADLEGRVQWGREMRPTEPTELLEWVLQQCNGVQRLLRSGAVDAARAALRAVMDRIHETPRSVPDATEPEEEWRPFDSAKELVGLDCPRIDWIKDKEGPLQEVGIRLKDGHHIRLRPDVEPCYSGSSVKLDGYALARCIIRVEERICGGDGQ